MAAKKPAALRRLEGDRGHRPIHDDLVAFGHPEPPPTLTPTELELWNAVIRSLPVAILSAADVGTLERLVVSWALFRETTAAIRTTGLLVPGRGGMIRNPLLIARKHAAEEMHACGLLLGMSPLARTKITQPKDAETDPLTLLALAGALVTPPARLPAPRNGGDGARN